MTFSRFLLLFALLFNGWAGAQNAYESRFKNYLQANPALTTPQLRAKYPAPQTQTAVFDPLKAAYFDSSRKVFKWTNEEIALLQKNGFMVTERVSSGEFIDVFSTIYRYDLPVYVSTDAILNALHYGYDDMLLEVETDVLKPKLTAVIGTLRNQLAIQALKYADSPLLLPNLRDLDIYLTVAHSLIWTENEPNKYDNRSSAKRRERALKAQFRENQFFVDTLYACIKRLTDNDVKWNQEKKDQYLQPVSFKLFSAQRQTIFLDAYEPAGHYDVSKSLAAYFQAFKWLSQTGFWLQAPIAANTVDKATVKRQTLDAFLLLKLIENARVEPWLNEIDELLSIFVGESDNLKLTDMKTLFADVRQPEDLFKPETITAIQAKIAKLPKESIPSQRLSSTAEGEGVEGGIPFTLLTQRFTPDAFIVGKVVFDQITAANGQKVGRYMPTSQDILFGLGNNFSLNHLDEQLNKYNYQANLAAVRQTVDEISSADSSLYCRWLSAIRSLNPPASLAKMPPFMQSETYWQKMMNTQLASYTHLLRDNNLTRKPTMIGGFGCSFPHSYVEPFPAFYRAVKTYAETAQKRFSQTVFNHLGTQTRIQSYLQAQIGIMDTLAAIAEKELANQPLSEAEIIFLKLMLTDKAEQKQNYAPTIVHYRGWFAKLYYPHYDYSYNAKTHQFQYVADVHSATLIENNGMQTYVLQFITKRTNVAAFIAPLSDGTPCIFVGPVFSFYESKGKAEMKHKESGYMHPDEVNKFNRPIFVQNYLANKDESYLHLPQYDDSSCVIHFERGRYNRERFRRNESALPDSIQKYLAELEALNNAKMPPITVYPTISAYPNPFRAEVQISSTTKLTAVTITDGSGRVVATLKSSPDGLLWRWNGADNAGQPAASGYYFANCSDGKKAYNLKLWLDR